MSPSDPDTRTSLILRIRDRHDDEAWRDFVSVYLPVILRLAKRKGLQDADAQDVAQQVLLSVSQALERRPHDPKQARFRTWLGRVAENATLNALSRRKPDAGTGRTDVVEFLHQTAHPSDDSAALHQETRRQVFLYAAEQIRPEFSDQTWEAFLRSSVTGRWVCRKSSRWTIRASFWIGRQC
ncbi:MAG: RNA polymerase subunit sigma [Planctomycetaceae bacterium]|nr:RNA polymerase subunit sigma [Planctomycetaceae bacterium]